MFRQIYPYLFEDRFQNPYILYPYSIALIYLSNFFDCRMRQTSEYFQNLSRIQSLHDHYRQFERRCNVAENIQRGFDNNPFKDIFAYRHLFAIPHSNKARKPP